MNSLFRKIMSLLVLVGFVNVTIAGIKESTVKGALLQHISGIQNLDLDENLEVELGTVIMGSVDEMVVKEVLLQYKLGIQNLDLDETLDLFVADSVIIESGEVEGTYREYIEHHLLPELKLFESFLFWDYKVNVEIQDLHAYAMETYNYRIVLKDSKKVIERKGVATTVLVKRDDKWKISMIHMSSLNP